MATAPFLVPTIQFEVNLPTAPLGYFSEVSGLSAEVELMTYNEGGRNDFVHHLPTRVKYPNLVLKQGITDKDELLAWFRKTHVEAERVNVSVTMLSADKQPLRTWSFANAFPVKWTGPSFNTGQSQVATEALEIVHEGMGSVPSGPRAAAGPRSVTQSPLAAAQQAGGAAQQASSALGQARAAVDQAGAAVDQAGAAVDEAGEIADQARAVADQARAVADQARGLMP